MNSLLASYIDEKRGGGGKCGCLIEREMHLKFFLAAAENGGERLEYRRRFF